MPNAKQPEEERQQSPTENWHLKKEINLTHIVTTVSVVISLLWWGSTVETRLVVQEQNLRSLAERFLDTQRWRDAQMLEIKELLRRIETKLDMKADKP